MSSECESSQQFLLVRRLLQFNFVPPNNYNSYKLRLIATSTERHYHSMFFCLMFFSCIFAWYENYENDFMPLSSSWFKYTSSTRNGNAIRFFPEAIDGIVFFVSQTNESTRSFIWMHMESQKITTATRTEEKKPNASQERKKRESNGKK